LPFLVAWVIKPRVAWGRRGGWAASQRSASQLSAKSWQMGVQIFRFVRI